MAKIVIQKKLCRKCGRCVDICPEGLFVQEPPGSIPRIKRQADCITCGHCASICPTGVVIHPDFDFARGDAGDEGSVDN